MFHSKKSFQNNPDKASIKPRRLFSFLFFVFILLLAIFLIPWKETWQILLSTDLLILGAAYSLTIPNQLFVAASFYIVIKKQNLDIKFGEILKLNIILIFYDVILPWSMLVSGLRWHRFNKYSGKPSRTIASIAYLKVFDVWITLLFSFSFILLFQSSATESQMVSVAVLIFAVSIILYLTPRLSDLIVAKMPSVGSISISNHFCEKVYKTIHKGISALANFKKLGIKQQVYLIILGILSQVIHYLGYIFFAESVGIQLSISQLGAIRAVILLATNIPINLGVGFSLREVTLVSLLVAVDVPFQNAVAMSIVMLSKSLFFGAIGGLIEGIQILLAKGTPI